MGSAQKRDKIALLQHGSVPISMDYALYARGVNSTPELVKERMTTLNEVSAKSKEDLINSLIFSFQSFIDNKLEEFEFNESDKREIFTIKKKYDSKNWNFIL